ncbi:MAG: hypothetical protein ACPGVG_08740 [Mycobacterium sp.]
MKTNTKPATNFAPGQMVKMIGLVGEEPAKVARVFEKQPLIEVDFGDGDTMVCAADAWELA